MAILRSRLRLFFSILFIGVLFFWLFWRLDSVPPLAYWWDEAWTMNVARNWIEHGNFGQFVNGKPQPIGLSASFVVVLPVALSFRIFGVGVWQARLVIALITISSLAVLYELARNLYHTRIAWGTIFVALFLSPLLLSNPIYMGRQVMAEMPMFLFLLAGYLCLFLSFRRPIWAAPMIILWGIGLATKIQPLPFWALSLIIPMIIAFFQHQWRSVFLMAIGLPGSWIVSKLLVNGFYSLMRGHILPNPTLKGLTQISALSIDPFSRQTALVLVLLTGIPVVVGIGYSSWLYWRKLQGRTRLAPREFTSLALLIFCGSWLFWYLFLSIGWARYFLPVSFIGSLFVSNLFHELTQGFDPVYIIKTSGYAIRHLRFNWRSLGALWFILCLVYNVDLTTIQWHKAFTAPPDGASQVAEFLNTQTVPNALVETYESGIIFLLKRPYHYPPDEVSVELLYVRADPNYKLAYDPMQFDPDYLVVGRFAREVKLYGPALETGQFQLVETMGLYEIYQRIRLK